MEPKRNLKRHKLIESDSLFGLSQQELISRITEISNQIHTATRTSYGSYMLFTGTEGARLFEEALGETNTPEIDLGDFCIEGNTYIQDIYLNPTRGVENITVDFNVLPTGGEFYDDNLTITFTGDT